MELIERAGERKYNVTGHREDVRSENQNRVARDAEDRGDQVDGEDHVSELDDGEHRNSRVANRRPSMQVKVRNRQYDVETGTGFTSSG